MVRTISGGGMGGGGTNCGFTTFQQCLDTVRGIGEFCEPNTQYVPPPSFSGGREWFVVVGEVVALVSLSLFLATVAVWAQVLGVL